MGLLKKFPWGIIAGASAIVVCFSTIGFVALYMVLGGVAAQTNETVGLFDEWYQSALFAAAVTFAVILIGSAVMYILKTTGLFDTPAASNGGERE